jgi:hypothetical protein
MDIHFNPHQLEHLKSSIPIMSTGNNDLELIVRKATNVFDEMRYSGGPFTIDELVDKIKGKEDKPILIEGLYSRIFVTEEISVK